MELKDLLAREQIRDCIARLARGEDRRDAELIKRCYWQDASLDFGIFTGSFAEYLAWVVPGSPAVPLTLHTLGQSLIDLHSGAAAVETHVASYHRIDMGEQHRDVVIGGRYLDRMEQREGEWRIAQRTLLYDWVSDSGPSVDWSKGVLGAPFKGKHSIGSTRGDFSETFFKQLNTG
ncbi:MAG TPA: nuclear transport factor 2 family protein [Steroidobacter sp.]|nr:nuclear transport factor 2 family protein [Steroidobacter sp.]